MCDHNIIRQSVGTSVTVSGIMAHNISDSSALEIVTDSGCKKHQKTGMNQKNGHPGLLGLKNRNLEDNTQDQGTANIPAE